MEIYIWTFGSILIEAAAVCILTKLNVLFIWKEQQLERKQDDVKK